MRRIRIAFVLVGLVLAVPVGLIVYRAQRAIEAERDARHAAVSERVFDEMERELTHILRTEEKRPPGEYGFYYVPERVASGAWAVVRSPLSLPPRASYIVGYFQIDPDRKVTSPLVPWDREYAIRHDGWEASPELDRMVREVEAFVLQALPERADVLTEMSRGRTAAAALGSDTEAAFRTLLSAAETGSKSNAEAVDAFQALRSLNRGTEDRPTRPEQRIELKVSRSDDTRGLEVRASIVRAPEPGGVAQDVEVPAEVRSGRIDDASTHLSAEHQTALVHPMVAAVAGEHLVLYRSVLIGDAAYQQGLVLDVTELTRFLYTQVLRGRELAGQAFFDFYLIPDKPRERDPRELARARVYHHFFAQPFNALALRMALPPLPELGGGGYLSILIVLLIAAAAVGLAALAHMVVVRLRFAERRSNFVAAVSHELKTPLTAIRMYSEMLRDGMVQNEEQRKEYYSTITAESERLTRLINNVLEFSRLEQGTREMSLLSGRLAPVVQEAARILEPHARSAGFELRVEIDDNLPLVRFDRDALLQVVFNLVDNALKYARDASDRVVVLHCRRQGDGVVLAVRDRGPGVSARHLSKIFEPFYRGEAELTRTAKGTGIGLALVKGLAERMGAAVSGRNAESGGFEVSLTFRAAAA